MHLREITEGPLVSSSRRQRYGDELSAQRLRSTASQPRPPAPTRLDSAFVGTWKGIVVTPDGEVPLTLAVADTGMVDATVGTEARSIVGRARRGTTLFIVALPGSLDAADAALPYFRQDFYFAKRGDELIGTVTTPPPSRLRLEGRVSYWVALRKHP